MNKRPIKKHSANKTGTKGAGVARGKSAVIRPARESKKSSTSERSAVGMVTGKSSRSVFQDYPGRVRPTGASEPRDAGQPGDDDQHDDPQARAEWFFKSRSDAKGKLLNGIWAKAATKRKAIERKNEILIASTPGTAGSVNWTPIGPSVIKAGLAVSGRITALVIGPGGNRVYAGAANGGVWFSLDGGATWGPLDDYTSSLTVFAGSQEADSLAIGAIAVRFGGASGDEVFVGTGEANPAYDSYFGVGIRHLVAGAWTLEAQNLAGHRIQDIVIDPDDVTPTHVFASTDIGLFRRPLSGNMGIWNHVSSVTITNPSGNANSLIVAGSGAAKLYYAAYLGDRVYSSPDCVTWTPLTGLAATSRIALAASESNPNVVYALRADGTLYRLDGTNFSLVTGLPGLVLFSDGGVGQGWYDIAIAVHPTDPNTVVLGGDAYAVFMGAITGSAGSYVFPFNAANTANPWMDPTWVGSGIHSDVHAIAYALNSSGTAHDPNNLWVGSDGGVFQSGTGGTAGSFRARNTGLAITEFSYLTQRADTDAVLLAGAQDNGTPRLLGEQASLETAGGDGGGVVFDPNSAYRAMRQYVYTYLSVTLDGGASWSGITFPPITSSATAQSDAAKAELNVTNFVAPLAATTDGTTTWAAFGTNRLWLNISQSNADWGKNWVTLPTATNPYALATPIASQDVIDNSSVTAIAFASPTRIFAATAGTIWRYDLTGSTWTSTPIPALNVAGAYFTALAVDNAGVGSFYATLGGGGAAHVYYFDGTAWNIAMPTSVVDVPTHAIAVDPSNPVNVYVGTDVGCWKGLKTGATTWTWTLFSQGLPEAAITDLAIHDRARLLRAATHGRSAWEIDLAATSGADPDVYLRVNYADTGRVNGSRRPWVEGALDPTHVGYLLYHWMSADIKVRRSSLTGLPPLNTPVDYLDFAVNIGDYVDTTTQIETADASGIDRIFVEVHNRSLTPVPASQVNVLLLVADASAGLPALPAGWTSHVNSLDTTSTWLGTDWRFVDSSSPYRTLVRDLDVRAPQVVEYQLDMSSLGLPAGHDHVCLLAFVTTQNDQIVSTVTDVNSLTMSDKHVAHRNTHLVPMGSMPGTVPSGQSTPQTMFIDVHNAIAKGVEANLIFDCTHFPGRLAISLPKQIELPNPRSALGDFHSVQSDVLQDSLQKAVEESMDAAERALKSGHFQEVVRRKRLAKLASIDRKRLFVASGLSSKPMISGIKIPARGMYTFGLTIQLPTGAVPGDRYRFDVLQEQNGTLIGGSTYIIAVTKPAPRHW